MAYEGPIQELIDELARLPGRRSQVRAAAGVLAGEGPIPRTPSASPRRSCRPRSASPSAANAATSPRAISAGSVGTSRAIAPLLCVVEEPKDAATLEKAVTHQGPLPHPGRRDQPARRHRSRRPPRAGAARPRANATTSPRSSWPPTRTSRATPPRCTWRRCSSRSAFASRGSPAGLPVGGDLEYADEVTLSQALEGRREM